MNIDKNLLNCICKQDVCSSAKLLWLLINIEEKDRSGFCYLPQPEWQDKLDTSNSQLKKHLKALHDKYLIEKDYRSDHTGGKKLYVKTYRPEALDNMTFFGTLLQIDVFKGRHSISKTAVFRNVYNIQDTIHFSYIFCDFKDEDYNARALEAIEEGESVGFKASVKKTEKGYSLSNIHNIKQRSEYYDIR